MKYRFSEIRGEVVRAMGGDPDNIDADRQASIDLRINMVQELITLRKPYEWRKRSWYLTTRTPYETGTVSTTQGSRTVTGSGTSWTDDMKVGIMVIGGRPYPIDRVASTTSIILKAPFHKTAVSGESYKIYYDKYTIPSYISAIVDVVYDGQELQAVMKSHRKLNPVFGNPEQYYNGEVNDSIFYNTGTVDVTNGSDSVTGNSTTFTALMEGMTFRVLADGEDYTVRERTSDTAITLDRPYQGTTASAANYEINPLNTQHIAFQPFPDDYYTYKLEGLIRPVKLTNDNDISIIPNHTPLIKGALYLALKDLEDANPVKIAQAKADFEDSLALFDDEYKLVKSRRILDVDTHTSRILGRFEVEDPLDQRKVR